MTGFLRLPDGSEVPVKDGLVIGRVAGCEVRLTDEKASRRHARLCVEAGVTEVEDLGSRNGVFVNGARVKRRILRPGDVLTIGTTELAYVAAPAAPEVAEAAGTAPLTDGDDWLDDPGPPVERPAPAEPRPAGEAGRTEARPPRADAAAPSPSGPAREAEPSRRGDDVEVIEFVDEVVEVRNHRLESSSSRGALPRARPTGKASGKAHRAHGVLQFNRQPDGGLLGDDLAQVGGALRVVWLLVGIALAAGLAFLAARFVA